MTELLLTEFERAVYLQDLLIEQATGGSGEDDEYRLPHHRRSPKLHVGRLVAGYSVKMERFVDALDQDNAGITCLNSM